MSLNVLKSAEFIASHAKHVKVNTSGVYNAAEFILSKFKEGYSIAEFKKHELNPKVADDKAIEWIFLTDVLNFSFYSDLDDVDRYAVEYKGKRYTGYWSLCAAVNRAIDEGIPITSADYMKKVTLEQLAYVFRAHKQSKEIIPLIEMRLNALHEAGNVLLQKFNGSFKNCILSSNKSARTLVNLIIENFSCFKDEALYTTTNVAFYKRAQILVADIWGCFEGKGLGEFHDIDAITMFADYRVPQILVGLNVLNYSEELNSFLLKQEEMKSGDEREIEIRGCSIWAVELIKREILKLDKEAYVNSILIDFFLWDYAKAQAKDLDQIPIHKIRSMFY